MNVSNVMNILDLIRDNGEQMHGKNVQVGFLSNREAVSIELSFFRGRLMTLSTILFDQDYDVKFSFLKGVIEQISAGDPGEVIPGAIRDYDRQFTF